jgi:hypothetical protein
MKYLKVITIYGLSLALIISSSIPAYGRRIQGGTNAVDYNISQNLESLIGAESAELITNLIVNEIPEEIRSRVVEFTCEILEDAREEAGEENQSDKIEDAWMTDAAFLAKLNPEIQEQDIEKLASIPGFGRIYGLLNYIVPTLIENLSIDNATTGDGSLDFNTAFEITKFKYRNLRVQLIAIKNSSTHGKDIVTAGINMAFRTLFLNDVHASLSSDEFSNNLDNATEQILKVAELEGKYVDLVKTVLENLRDNAEEANAEFTKKHIEAIEAIDLNNPNYTFEIIAIDGKNYLNIESYEDKIYILAEYTDRKSIDRVLVSIDGITYVDIDSLNDEDKARELKALISNIDLSEIGQSVEANQHLFDDLKFEDIQNLLDNKNITYMERPLLLFLLSQPLNLKLLSNINTYTLTDRRDAGALYSPWTHRIAGPNQNSITSPSYMIHEITHSLFNALLDNDVVDKHVRNLKKYHKDFYDNINKHPAYKNLNTTGKTNELIAYLMQSLTRGSTEVRTFDENGNSKLDTKEAICYGDIEILVELGFLPSWAAPSVLYKENPINNNHPIEDTDYYVQLFEYYTENCEDLL